MHWFQELVGWLIGSLVVFYGISTFVGYLLPNPVYTYIISKSKAGDLNPEWPESSNYKRESPILGGVLVV